MPLEDTKARTGTAPAAPILSSSAVRKRDRSGRRVCRVMGCKIRTNQFFLMHQFPDPDKEPDRYAAWMKAISFKLNRKDWRNMYICSKHFEEKYFIGMDLSPTAVPTLNLSFVENASYVEKRATDELTNYLQRKSALMEAQIIDSITPLNIPDLPDKALQRDNILPSGTKCKPLQPMLYKCSVKGCGFTTTEVKQLFLFPHYPKKNNVRLKQWLSLVALAERTPVKQLRICNQHFTPNSYQDSTYTSLKEDALPTLRTGRMKRVRLLSVPPPKHIIEMCFACLATEVRMQRLSKEQVEQYNSLLGFQADNEIVPATAEAIERLPPAVCYECLATLARLNSFKERARRARNTLKDVVQSKTLDQSVRDINRRLLGLESPLSWCSLDGLCIEAAACEEPDLDEPITLDMDVHVDDCRSDDNNTGSYYECETCGDKFIHKTTLERHIDSHRPDEEWGLDQNVCEQCFESFPTPQALLAHTSRHLLRTSHKYIEIFDTRPLKEPDYAFSTKATNTNHTTDANTQKPKRKKKTVKTRAAGKSALKNKKEPPKMKKIARVDLMRDRKVEEILHIDLKGTQKEIVRIDLKEELSEEVKDESFSDVEMLDEQLDDDVL